MRLSKKLAPLAIAAGVAVTATAAFAVWSATGGGAGSATAYSAQSTTVTATAAPAAARNLYPGGPGVDVTGSANNTNPYDISFAGWQNAAVASVSGPNISAEKPCGTTDFQIAAGSGSFSSALSIVHDGTSAVTVPGAVQMKSTAGDGCQGAKVVVSFDLTGGTQVIPAP